MIRPSVMKQRVDVDAVAQNRRIFSQLPAREAAELPVRTRRRQRPRQEAFEAFRALIEGGRR